jgi:acyl transferase domain-containing protein/acyl carrier protein
MTQKQDGAPFGGIAIIGMSGRFPGAGNLSEFWCNLRNGRESISFFSQAETAVYASDPAGSKHLYAVNAGGVLDGIELFDASFFGISPVEAATLDPQQRLLLECAWHALEDAGYDPETCQEPIGIYAGSAMSTYLFNLISNAEHRALAGEFLVFTGNDKDFLTTRISYKLNLKGPSIAVQTACSTSLVAVAAACDSLLNHQCSMALAGGVAIRIPQTAGYIYQEGQIFSRDGHTRSFDAEASGTLFSNGLGLVVLKRLEDAIADRDNIRAVIRGTAVNNDGSLKVGYAAPSLDAQAEVVAMAQAMAGIDAATIGYVEAHGTATPMGDSIEVAALTKAFRACTREKTYCALGSVKSNVGHLDAASGVAALIKTVLSLENEAIPASINFTRPNPKIDFNDSPFFVNTELRPWPSGHTSRFAGVHSFGIGGTNAHVVVEEAPKVEPSPSLRSRHLLVLSARSRSALHAATTNFATHCRQHPKLDLADVTYTCQLGRREFSHRQILVCKDSEDAADALGRPDSRRVRRATKTPSERSLAFLFPGNDAARAGICGEMYKSEPTFRRHIDHCSEMLKARLGLDLRDLLRPSGSHSGDATQFNRNEVAELATFVVAYALTQLWQEWGVRPHMMMGQGVGEYVAGCLADVFSLADALSLLAIRDPLMRLRAASNIIFRPPKIPFVSSTTGTWVTPTMATNPSYWAPQPDQAGRVANFDCLLAASNRVFLEVGPGHTLATLLNQHPALREDHTILSPWPCDGEHESDTGSMLDALGRLWLLGFKIDWLGFWRHENRRRASLPTYTFDRKRYWVEPNAQSAAGHIPRLPNTERTSEGDQQVTLASPCTSKCAIEFQPEATYEAADFYAAPTDDVERNIAEIWQRLLGVEKIGIYDNFFALGGHSMLGAQLLASLRSAFHIDIPLPSLFDVPTVAGMAERVRAFR